MYVHTDKKEKEILNQGNCNTLSACSLFNLYLLQFENNQFLRNVFIWKFYFIGYDDLFFSFGLGFDVPRFVNLIIKV